MSALSATFTPTSTAVRSSPEPAGAPARIMLALRLVHTDGRGVQHVLVDAPAGSTWADLQPLLPPAWRDVDAYVDAHLLRRDDLVGDHPLVHLAPLRLRPSPRPRRALLELAVAEGPESGSAHVLDVPTTLGRDATAAIVVRDPALSRVHLELRAAHGHVELLDLDSTNGTTIDEEPAPPGDVVEVGSGARIRAGNTVLRVHTPGRPRPQRWTNGHREIHRPPRMMEQLEPHELREPHPPVLGDARMPWLLLLFPLPIAIGLALLLRSPMFLAFGLFGPVMMAAHHLHERRSGRTSRTKAIANHRRATRAFAARRTELLAAELAGRRRMAPDLAQLQRLAEEGRCWARRSGDPDHLLWRVGTGHVQSMVSVRDSDDHLVRPTLSACPVTVDLGRHTVVGLSADDPDVLRRAVDGMVGQLAVLHSPELLTLVVISDAADATWAWARWLPHLRARADQDALVLDVDRDAERIGALLRPWTAPLPTSLADERQPATGHHTVVVLDLPEAGRRTVLRDLLQHGAEHGVSVIAACADREALPTECSCEVHLASVDHAVVRSTATRDQSLVPDLPATGWPERVAAALGPMRDVTPRTGAAVLADQVLLSELPGAMPQVEELLHRWTQQPRSTCFTLGLTSEGPEEIDLVRDGPHMLIGGTTGSGKSELLQGMIAALATANRPDELVFLLVDYKGGAAFEHCSALPHAVGLVTDLDAFLTRRALRSLEAEIHRRERLFAAAGAKDLTGYQQHRLAHDDAPAVPRLVLVVDEFRVLAEELPDFIDGIVRLAAVGRSLGIHLVLATQRPAGVVTADIRANVSLRIALRVRDGADSHDIIETDDAARIATTTPGRAWVRTGSGRPTLVQTPHVGGSSSSPPPLSVRLIDPGTGRGAAAPSVTVADEHSDLAEVVRTCRDAAQRAGISPLPSPWLPPLPYVVTRADLDAHRGATEGSADGLDLGVDSPTASLPAARLGLADMPAEQCRKVLRWPPASGHLALMGGPRSGRTSAVRTVVLDLVDQVSADDLHVYVIDGSGALSSLEHLPHCGAVVDARDGAAVRRLLAWACQQIRDRQGLLAASGGADLAELRSDSPRVSAAGDGAGDPAHAAAPAPIVLAIDGWESFSDQYESTDPAVVDMVTTLLRDGLACGISLVLTGGRALVSGRVAALVSHRLCLRTADELDAVMAGLRPAQIPASMPPGRALVLPDATEVQLAVPIADTSGAALTRHLEQVAVIYPAARVNPPVRFPTLPDRVTRADIRASAGVPTGAEDEPHGDPLLGLGGDDVTPVYLHPDPGLGMAALIAGDPGSGRSTCLLTVATQLRARGPVLWWAGSGLMPRTSHLAPDDDVESVGGMALEMLWDRVVQGYSTLVVDDIDLVDDPALLELVAAHAARTAAGEGALLLSGGCDRLLGHLRGPVHDLRRRGNGVLLRPTRGDGDLFGTTVPTGDKPLPGRGVLLRRGRAIALQVALTR